uniref:Uncharacterized protein n=1 Tax=Populus alba TaxID=43335 RepID=A0A4V6A8E5_POPAL|nr:hypothetical protein D5086_0000160970 [Populus alba]
MVYIRFVALQPASIPVEEMDPLDTEVRGIPDDSEEIERGLVAVNSPDGDIMWETPISMRMTIGKWLPQSKNSTVPVTRRGPPEIKENNKTIPQMKTKRLHHA